MPDYRRTLLRGGTFFFTVVTYERHPIFREEQSVELLWQCLEAAIQVLPFKVDAFVVLPDHLHMIWTLPEHESDFSTRWKLVKGTFSHRNPGSRAADVSGSMRAKNEKGIWQRRFWEHAIRDQRDFDRHRDYIHYNPVRHGLVRSPVNWKHSSFRGLVEQGAYPENWGDEVDRELADMDCE